MQYTTRGSALNALKKMTTLRAYNIEGEERTPAEEWLVQELIALFRLRSIKTDSMWKRKQEAHFRHLKSIARGLGLWSKGYFQVMVRLDVLPSDLGSD